MNWLGRKPEDDSFGKALLDAGIPESTLNGWGTDPQIIVATDGATDSVFDTLEDMDVTDCLAKMMELHKLQS